MTTVVGFLEATQSGYRNSAAVLTADGRTVVVHKTHLPHLGADRFAEPGARIGPVVDSPFGKLGVAICYDFRFPEVCRSLALAGAEIIAVPVNWSTAVTVLAEHFVPVARGREPRVHRRREPRRPRRRSEFFGSSQIVAPCGQALGRAADPRAGHRARGRERRPPSDARPSRQCSIPGVRDRRLRRSTPRALRIVDPREGAATTCAKRRMTSRSTTTSRSRCPTARSCSPTSRTPSESTTRRRSSSARRTGERPSRRTTRWDASWPSGATGSSCKRCAARTVRAVHRPSSPSAATAAPPPTGSPRSRGSTGASGRTARVTWASPSGRWRRPRRRTSTRWSSRCRPGDRVGTWAARLRSS